MGVTARVGEPSCTCYCNNNRKPSPDDDHLPGLPRRTCCWRWHALPVGGAVSLESTSRRYLFLNADHRPPPRRQPYASRAYKYWNDRDECDYVASVDARARVCMCVCVWARACSLTAVVQHNAVSSGPLQNAPRTRPPSDDRGTNAASDRLPRKRKCYYRDNNNIITVPIWYFAGCAGRRCGRA